MKLAELMRLVNVFSTGGVMAWYKGLILVVCLGTFVAAVGVSLLRGTDVGSGVITLI